MHLSLNALEDDFSVTSLKNSCKYLSFRSLEDALRMSGSAAGSGWVRAQDFGVAAGDDNLEACFALIHSSQHGSKAAASNNRAQARGVTAGDDNLELAASSNFSFRGLVELPR